MKKFLVFISLLHVTNVLVNAQEKGGMGPCIASCCVGPRVGLEMNEGKPIETDELVNMCIPCIIPYKAFEKNGLSGCFWACLVGPRVGMQIDYRRLRKKEIFMMVSSLAAIALTPVVPGVTVYEEGGVVVTVSPIGFLPAIGRLFICFEAFKGTTMTEIEQRENLRTSNKHYQKLDKTSP